MEYYGEWYDFGIMVVSTLNKAEKLHHLILDQNTGTGKELARKIGVSKTELYLLIDELNNLDFGIAYSQKYQTFQYSNNKK